MCKVSSRLLRHPERFLGVAADFALVVFLTERRQSGNFSWACDSGTDWYVSSLKYEMITPKNFEPFP